jgi:hypothetical protein
MVTASTVHEHGPVTGWLVTVYTRTDEFSVRVYPHTGALII